MVGEETRVRWWGFWGCGGGGYCIYGINERGGNLKERDNLEDIGVGGGG